MDDSERTKEFLQEQTHMVLAVTLHDGTPWAVPVRIKLQWGNMLEWESRLDTEHSRAIKRRPDVAITVYGKNGDEEFGFYAKAQAKLMEEYKPGYGRYQALIHQAWINDETFVKRKVELAENE